MAYAKPGLNSRCRDPSFSYSMAGKSSGVATRRVFLVDADACGDVRYWHKADIPSCTAHVRFGGKADIGLVDLCLASNGEI